MNKIETPQDRYQDSVWNSQYFSNQKSRPEQGVLTKLLQGGDPLPWSRANETVPVSIIEEPTPAEIKQRLKENKDETHWDENQYSAGSLNKWGLVYFYLSAISKVVCTMVSPFFAVYITVFPFLYESVTLSELIDIVLVYILFILLPSALIWGYFEASGRGYLPMPWFMKAVKHFTFSRSTGRVIRYKNNKELYSHPFSEFDCYLVSSPSHQGILSYQLHLVHRYHRYSDSIPLHTFSSSQQPDEFERIWNLIQRYMDTSQPMPDVPELEPAREKDPTTAAWDAKNNRKPDYWFSMDDDEFEEALLELQAEQRFMPNQGPEIDLFNGGTKA
ncbi:MULTISPECIES: hypothetical protein [unclassified Neptuniibacter]|uniref:hypothetical protein n=1 Tax=unclassified Neptuniibacter TaxID=2630693 RepID=UPI000C3733AD|nr:MULTISPECIES: hypothetical protein [unclassified Neptuniibacter]MAY43227.1 hypothetical protein [Oceanospirillaceae bacterium]